MTDVSNTLNARSARYGMFSVQAAISQLGDCRMKFFMVWEMAACTENMP